jgi:hypothetical protein
VLPQKYLPYPVYALSGGNKKKMSLYLSQLAYPSLLLLDECTTGVDPVAAEAIVQQLLQLKPSQGMIFASHRIDECTSLCTRVLMLHDGKVFFDGPVGAFEQIASLFYQVDIVFATAPPATAPADHMSSTSTHADNTRMKYSFSSPELSEAAALGSTRGGGSRKPSAEKKLGDSSVLSALQSLLLGNELTEAQQTQHVDQFDGLKKLFVELNALPSGKSGRSRKAPYESSTAEQSASSKRARSQLDSGNAASDTGAEFEHCEKLERMVEYSPSLVRLTFEKSTVEVTVIWGILQRFKEKGLILRYAFRAMDMEETLAIIIESSKYSRR